MTTQFRFQISKKFVFAFFVLSFYAAFFCLVPHCFSPTRYLETFPNSTSTTFFRRMIERGERTREVEVEAKGGRRWRKEIIRISDFLSSCSVWLMLLCKPKVVRILLVHKIYNFLFFMAMLRGFVDPKKCFPRNALC